MLAGGWVETVIYFCESPQAFAAALQTNSPHPGAVWPEATIGFWQIFYQGAQGRQQWGIQCSYVTKTGWSVNHSSPSSTLPGPGISSKAVDNMARTFFRYFIP